MPRAIIHFSAPGNFHFFFLCANSLRHRNERRKTKAGRTTTKQKGGRLTRASPKGPSPTARRECARLCPGPAREPTPSGGRRPPKGTPTNRRPRRGQRTRRLPPAGRARWPTPCKGSLKTEQAPRSLRKNPSSAQKNSTTTAPRTTGGPGPKLHAVRATGGAVLKRPPGPAPAGGAGDPQPAPKATAHKDGAAALQAIHSLGPDPPGTFMPQGRPGQPRATQGSCRSRRARAYPRRRQGGTT